MNQQHDNPPACPGADVAAYLDGELDAAAEARFTAHLRGCSACAAGLREQRMLLCELDFMLELEEFPALPENFAEVVTVRAQADLRGVREHSESKRALKLCLVLGLFAFALLGGAWRATIWEPLRRLVTLFAAAADFVADALYDAGAGVAVLSRNLSGHLFFQSGWQTALIGVLLLIALFCLARLVGDYHRNYSAE